jgi:hypothetical protein
MNIFFPKFLVQALQKRAERKLGGREGRSDRVATQGGGGVGEEERAALAAALLVDGLGLERADRLARERERTLDTFVSVTRSTSSSVICRKGFHTPSLR